MPCAGRTVILALVKVPGGCFSTAATAEMDNGFTSAVCTASLNPVAKKSHRDFVSWHYTVGLKLRLQDHLDEEDSFEVWVHRWVWGWSPSGQGSLKFDMSSSSEALIYSHRLWESFSSGQNFLAWQLLCWDQCRGCRQRCLVFHLPVCLHLLFPALEFRRKLFVGGDLFFWWACAALYHSGSLICERGSSMLLQCTSLVFGSIFT